MSDLVFGFLIGLVVGWNFLKQPAWVKTWLDKAIEWIKSLFGKKE